MKICFVQWIGGKDNKTAGRLFPVCGWTTVRFLFIRKKEALVDFLTPFV